MGSISEHLFRVKQKEHIFSVLGISWRTVCVDNKNLIYMASEGLLHWLRGHIGRAILAPLVWSELVFRRPYEANLQRAYGYWSYP